MTARLRFAVVLTFACHTILILAGRYRQSYDAYTHMFFADHYLHHWGTLWDARWYTGFSVTSYPPLVHQFMALIAFAVGVDAAFAILLLVVLVGLTLAVYAFARVFTSPDGASYAAIGAAVLPSIYLSAHVFGQLPTLTAALFALLGLACLARYLLSGHRIDGGLTVALFTVVIAAHHATALFLPFAALAVCLHLLLHRPVTRRTLLLRMAAVTSLSLLAGLLVIWPFWLWGTGQTLQTPIDHASRHNFLTDPSAFLVFFVPVYGLLALIIPMVLFYVSRRALVAPALLFVVLFILGLGGTTPLPRLLFGANWAWLTYDRFALWASLVLLIFFGQFAATLKTSGVSETPEVLSRGRSTRALLFLPPLVLSAFAAALFPLAYPTQPPPIDMRPIVTFLNAADHAQYRYLTFGFGDQYAALSLLTRATTIDGSYHTARKLPELRNSGIGQIDSALWTDKGVDALDPILQQSTRYSIRWGFVNRAEYVPVLQRNGWLPIRLLSNGVVLWENPAVTRPITQPPPTPDDPLQTVSWGVFPLTALVLVGVLAAGYARQAVALRVLRGIRTLAVALLPFGLSFWLFNDLAAVDYSRIYFTYDHVLLFLSDGLILIAVIAWGLYKLIDHSPHLQPRNANPTVTWLTRILFALCTLATLSVLWSGAPLVSLDTSLHLWLLFGLYYSLKDQPVSLRVVIGGALLALVLQAGIGFSEFVLQSTSFLAPLNLTWPGIIEPAMRGVSVVQLANGARWLRVYGTLPHPNILGGLTLALLAGPAAWFLLGRRYRWVAAISLIMGMLLLFVTFSRAAWLGGVVAAGVLASHHRQFERKRLQALALASAIVLGVLIGLIPLGQIALTRFTGFNVPTEQQSIEDRTWITQQALQTIRNHPFLGVGIGDFAIDLAKRDQGTYMIEPVHSLPLLVVAELGIPGLLLLGAAAITLWVAIRHAGNPAAVITSAMLAGLTITAIFDHYLWTLAPGRALLWYALGLWASGSLPATNLFASRHLMLSIHQ